MYKKIFTPKFMMLFSSVPYAIFAIYSYIKVASLVSLFVFLGLGLLIFLYYLFFNKNKDLTKRDFWIMVIVSSLIVFIFSMLIYNFFDRTNNTTMPFIIMASIPVVYNIMGIANFSLTNDKDNAVLYLLGMVLVPFTMFMIFNFIGGSNFQSIQMIFIIFMYYTIIFLIIHICFAFIRSKRANVEREIYGKTYYVITFILGIFLPVLGLTLNLSGIIGDFSYPIFFIIAITNGALLLIPIPKNKNVRLVLFYLKSVGYSYILYFFIAFVPLIPLGFLLLVFIVGILIFAPLLITLWQGRILIREWKALKVQFNSLLVIGVFILGIVTIPLSLFALIYNDRPNLENAVTYLNKSDENKNINLSALNRSLKFIETSYISNNRMGFMNLDGMFNGNNIPIISSIYSKYVMQDQVLSHTSLNSLKNIFFDKSLKDNVDEFNAPSNNVELYDYKVETSHDNETDAYRSLIKLQLKNNDGDKAEYKTKFTLPEGAFISDYYLYVNNEKKEGILADHRAATFVYNKIVSRALDPGILHYIDENTLELKVFPFSTGEIRNTGFEIIHKGSFDFSIDGKTISVKGDDNFTEVNAGNVAFLNSSYINKMPLISREAQYNFVIDCSKNSDIEFLKKQLSDYIQIKNIKDANVYFITYKVEKSDLNDFKNASVKQEGGFNLNLAIKTIFENTNSKKFPIIIAVTENMPNSVFGDNSKAHLYPESEFFYSLNHNFTLTPYSFLDNEKKDSVKDPVIAACVSYNGIAVKKDGKDHLVLNENEKSELNQNQYENALILYGQGNGSTGKEIISNVRNSFRARILTKNTAFIVVETKDQEKDLLYIQEQLLSGEKTDVIPTQSLSEPPIFIIIILTIVIILFKPYIKKMAIAKLRN